MKTKFLLCALLLLSGLTTWASASSQITQPAIDQIRIGETTEGDLVQLFGPPTTRFVDMANDVAVDWFRSVPAPAKSYIPIIGPFLGGPIVEAQQLTVVLSPAGRVVSYEVHSSRDTLHAAGSVRTVTRTSYAK